MRAGLEPAWILDFTFQVSEAKLLRIGISIQVAPQIRYHMASTI